MQAIQYSSKPSSASNERQIAHAGSAGTMQNAAHATKPALQVRAQAAQKGSRFSCLGFKEVVLLTSSGVAMTNATRRSRTESSREVFMVDASMRLLNYV